MTDSENKSLQNRDFPYYRRTWNRVVAALLAGSFIPLLLIGGVIYCFYSAALKEEIISSVKKEVVYHKNSISLFIENGIALLDLAADEAVLKKDPSESRSMEGIIRLINDDIDFFTDLNIVDEKGRLLAGRRSNRLESHYGKAADQPAFALENKVWVSDILTDKNNKTSFALAVRKPYKEGFLIITAIIGASILKDAIENDPPEAQKAAYLVNASDRGQTRTGSEGLRESASGLTNIEKTDGVHLHERNGEVIAQIRLENAPWLYIVKFDKEVLFKRVDQIFRIAVFVFFLGAIPIIFTVLLTTNNLILMLEQKHRNAEALDLELQRYDRLESFAAITDKMAEQLKSSLINIEASVDIIRETSSGLKADAELHSNLAYIKRELGRGHRALRNYSESISGNEEISLISEININKLLENLTDRIINGFYSETVEAINIFQHDLPPIRGDYIIIASMFQNLLINALSLIESSGLIRTTTKAFPDHVLVILMPLKPDNKLNSTFNGKRGEDMENFPQGNVLLPEQSELKNHVRHLALEKDDLGRPYYVVELRYHTHISKNDLIEAAAGQ